MVLIPKKRDGEEGLMFVDINIASQKRGALVDTRASDLFISEKAAKKLGLSIKKSNKNIKTVNFEEASTVGVVRNVELQIDEWKGNEEFKVIQLDDYDYVLGLNFLDKIQVGTKVLSSIQLVEDVSYRRNIDLIERNATKALSEKLMEHEINMRLVESTVEPPPLGKVGCVSDFEGKEDMQKQ
ncbi:hypothetical protein Goarm_002133, partial [Gossypium armourianum]|nr:hypothetical protein [Gossypium armourianum]